MEDYHINTLANEIARTGLSCPVGNLRTLLFSDFTPLYNPFDDYANRLPLYDGTTDYIGMLANTVVTTDTALWHTCFRMWIVAAIGCLLRDDVVNQTVLVFSGDQGIGKTTWLEKLVPPELWAYYFGGEIDPGNKDTLALMAECFIINLDELENLSKSSIGALKDTITKSSIQYRPPYGYTTVVRPRRASFVGSINSREFLSDLTGNRRFLCFEATHIRFEHDVPIDMVYAQALHLLNTGFKFWFDKEDIAAIHKNNEQYRVVPLEEELLMEYFEPCLKELATHDLSTTDIIKYIRQSDNLPMSESTRQKMGRVLKAKGFVRHKKNGKYVWALKERIRSRVQGVPQQFDKG
jgi:predicted P-loop ATPase